MERTTLFRVKEPVCEDPEVAAKKSVAVAVVDPFSTGAVLAAELVKSGYKVYAGAWLLLLTTVALVYHSSHD